ncbi:hypothetical protein AVEN_260204-1 [Araneus ventricosus]|uniref:Uncharacterized protein n=1 Tax=Araneus ventricosus TaxID=182803 RepID=A0A4Y2VNX9_ARAVE|nr:hypothetical protein AVEN_260204-1 [Araneus ventricosus]
MASRIQVKEISAIGATGCKLPGKKKTKKRELSVERLHISSLVIPMTGYYTNNSLNPEALKQAADRYLLYEEFTAYGLYTRHRDAFTRTKDSEEEEISEEEDAISKEDDISEEENSQG